MYYHATFATNYDSIFKHGLLKSANRIWEEVSSKHLIYLDDTPTGAVEWMELWYYYQMVAGLSFTEGKLSGVTSKEFDKILNDTPHIHDGLIVLEVNPNGILIKPRYDPGTFPEDHPIDYICRKNIPPSNLHVINQIDASDIINKLSKYYKKKWVRWGLPE